MPTGYTAPVEDGTLTDFSTFALRCARAFGASVMQRERPLEEPPTHREVDDYYLTSVAQSEARVKELAAMTDAQADDESRAAHEKAEESRLRYLEQNAFENDRYDAMLAKVAAWNPPTSEHQGLKRFMREQLEESKHRGDYYGEPTLLLSGKDWRTEELGRAVRSLERAQERLADEVKRCAVANAWIDALYASLKENAHV